MAGVVAHRLDVANQVDKRFDGDALNFSIAIDNFLAKKWYSLAPHKNVFLLTNPREISKNIAIPEPVVATISNFISSPNGYVFTSEQIARFEALPEAA